MRKLASAIYSTVALFYACGALVHVLNIAGIRGFDWSGAPLKWQVLDVVYLLIDLIVCFGILARWRPAPGFFAAAALSQIVLYTVLRGWIIAVPAPYTVTPEQANYLTNLVLFHVTTLVLVFGEYRLAGPAHFWRPRTAAA